MGRKLGPLQGYPIPDPVVVEDLGEFIVNIGRSGFIEDDTTIAFNESTYVFTLTMTGLHWSYYRDGDICTITESKEVTIPGTPPTANSYYIYIDSNDGVLLCSTTPWDLSGTKVPVAIIIFNNTLTPKYFLLDERHTCKIDKRMHRYLHFSHGTQVITLPTLSDYVVPVAAPSSDDDNTFAISASEIADEDLFHTITALTDPSGSGTDYTILYRTDATTYLWVQSPVPFRYTTSGYIQYDNSGTMTEGSGSNYYNTYLMATTFGYIIIHGRAEFASLALAQVETPDLFIFTGFQSEEGVIVYQLTWVTNSSYTTKGKCKLASAPKYIFTPVTSGKAK